MTTNTKVADLPAKWRAWAKRIRGITAGSDLAADIMDGAAEDLEAALARQEADKPAAPVGQEIAYLDLGVGGYIDLGSAMTDEQLAKLPKGRHALGIIGTYGVDGYVAAPPAAQAVDHLRRLIGAGKLLRNSVVETRGMRGMDTHDAALALAEQFLALIDQQAGKGVDRA